MLIIDFIAKEGDESTKSESRFDFKVATLEQARLKVNTV